MNCWRLLVVSSLLMVAPLAIGDGVVRAQQPQQQQPAKPGPPRLDLPHATEDLNERYQGIPDLAPISLTNNRWLVPAGDILYMVDANSRIVWEFSVEPNFIYGVAVDAKGLIYIAVFDGLLIGINDAGEKVWSKFMSGSANYTQLKRYGDGVLAVLSIEAYRSKGSDREDILVFWKNDKDVWRKDFPRNARLEVSGDRIMAVKTTKAGKEITFIR